MHGGRGGQELRLSLCAHVHVPLETCSVSEIVTNGLPLLSQEVRATFALTDHFSFQKLFSVVLPNETIDARIRKRGSPESEQHLKHESVSLNSHTRRWRFEQHNSGRGNLTQFLAPSGSMWSEFRVALQAF